MYEGLKGTAISVPPLDRYAAQALGARWSEPYGTWYVPNDLALEPFARWVMRTPDVPRLVSELVPRTCWCSNVRDHLLPDDWRELSRAVYKAANYRCEICGGQGDEHPVENHEVWRYDDGIQRLERFIALCPSCHLCKHPGFAQKRGLMGTVFAQFKHVNGWAQRETEAHLRAVFEEWAARSRYNWRLDLSHLRAAYGVDVLEKR